MKLAWYKGDIFVAERQTHQTHFLQFISGTQTINTSKPTTDDDGIM